MKIFLALVGLTVAGCSPLPRTEIHAIDRNGTPISGLPLQMEFSDGLSGYALPRSFGSTSASKVELRTDKDGRAAVEYTFTEKQPSDLRSVLFGVDRVSNQWIKVTPMRELPRGSAIVVGIPNP